jgi:BMFP domain-containing protein YqiC
MLDEAQEKKLAEYEEIFRKVKEATGVNKLEDVISKFKGQEATQTHLLQLRSENEAILTELKKKKAKLTAEFESVKFCGQSRFVMMDKHIEELGQLVDSETKIYTETREEHVKSESILVRARAGLKNLNDKLDVLPVVSFSLLMTGCNCN